MHTISTIAGSRRRTTPRRRLSGGHRGPRRGGWLMRVLMILAVWQARADDRSQLAQMDSHQLRDIGCGWFEIEAEIHKPFWRA